LELQQINFEGPPIDDWAIIEEIPLPLADLLQKINGLVQFHGGLHLRGACLSPQWHSLRDAWHGPFAFHRTYQSIWSTDVPFGEDCVGDQFFLRDDIVWKLLAETDEVRSMDVPLANFLEQAQKDPVEYLEMHPLLQYINERGQGLDPGKLLSVYPPFCTAESGAGVDLRAISTLDRRRFLIEFAFSLRQVPDGAKISIKTCD
jgi:hypothetical protein